MVVCNSTSISSRMDVLHTTVEQDCMDVALLVNILFIFSAKTASFGAVLTLGGIAGIVLTIGTSVDANVPDL
jgi:hypothetical protein